MHEKAITAFGWTGYGYTIVDPDTGAGAYLIEGKGNGGIAVAMGSLAATGIFWIAMMLGENPSPAAVVAYIEAMKWIVLPYMIFCISFLGTLVVAYDTSLSLLASCFISGFLLIMAIYSYNRIAPSVQALKDFSFPIGVVLLGWLGLPLKKSPTDCQ